MADAPVGKGSAGKLATPPGKYELRLTRFDPTEAMPRDGALRDHSPSDQERCAWARFGRHKKVPLPTDKSTA